MIMENIMPHPGALAQHADLNDPKLLVGSWTMGEELGPPDWAIALAAKLGPFTLAHDDGRPGCR